MVYQQLKYGFGVFDVPEDVILTDHAVKRIRQRLGWPKKSVPRMVQKVLERGFKPDDLHGFVSRHLSWIEGKERRSTKVFFYANYVWVFVLRQGVYTLITVLPIPSWMVSKVNQDA